jgi:hypothetical protein
MKKTAVLPFIFILHMFSPTFFCSDRVFALDGEKKQELVDRVLAVVNDEVITLTDVKIYSIVAEFMGDQTEKKENDQGYYLEQMIDQKLVLQMIKEEGGITEAEVLAFKNKIDESDRRDQFYASLSDLGLFYEDIRSYVEEILLMERIINQRFNRAASVSIREIEQYYREIYIPRQQAGGLDLKPMVDILDDIETALKKEKIDKQVKVWIANLKKEAEIEIKNPLTF